MTQRKHFKQLVRDSMKKFGQRYAAARRAILQSASAPTSPHRPGLVPGATALRVLLAHRGIDYSEAMTFGLAGGVGIGVFAFYYEKADFASFFVAGRHCWHDHGKYLTRACQRLHQTPIIKEASTPKAAEKALRDMLAAHGPCVAWVDLAGLPHRGLQHLAAAGGGYHLITVYAIDDAAGAARIGDLADEPIAIPLADLAAARGRIKKDKHRLLAIERGTAPTDLRTMLKDALTACHRGLTGAEGVKSAARNFSLDALESWAERLISTKDKERWERVFAPGHRFLSGLMSLHLGIEHYGSGGGLARPLMSEFLLEAARALNEPGLKNLGDDYAKLGEQWSELADAALPDDVPILAKTKEHLTRYAELVNSGGTAGELADCWKAVQALETQARAQFPLTDSQCRELRSRLAERVRALHAAEVAAHRQLVAVL